MPPCGVGVAEGDGEGDAPGVGEDEPDGLGDEVSPGLGEGDGLAPPLGEGEAPLAGGVASGVAAWWPITPTWYSTPTVPPTAVIMAATPAMS